MNMHVDPYGPTPLWQQVIRVIRENIATGRWRINERIPSERELSAQLGISRNTVRQAIAEAVNAGLLRRAQGKGTFVAPPKIDQPLYWMTTFEETLRLQGLEPGTRLLQWKVRPAPQGVSERLNGNPRGPVTHVRLVGLGSSEPMAVYDSYLPLDIAGRIQPEIERRLQAGRVVFVNRIVAHVFGWSYLDAEQTYEVSVAGARVARVLGLDPRTPVFVVTSLFTSPEGRPVEYRRAVYRGDKYQFHIRRRVLFDAGSILDLIHTGPAKSEFPGQG